MRKRKAYGTVNSGPQVGGQLDEFVTFVDENELVCVLCNKNFASMANKSQHVCKGARLPRDMLSTEQNLTNHEDKPDDKHVKSFI